MKIYGVVMIIFGCFSLYQAAQAVKQGEITPFESTTNYQIKRGDPDFDEEVSGRRVVGFTLVGLGTACLFIKSRRDKDKN